MSDSSDARQVVPRVAEVEVPVRLDACGVVGVGPPPRRSTKKGTAVTNNYRTTVATRPSRRSIYVSLLIARARKVATCLVQESIHP